jgi:gluconate 2-dehydrogenase gamma chain
MYNFTRREWLVAAACWAEVLNAQKTPAAYRYLDAETASQIEAIAETIMLGDQTPGAREAGVIWFIDASLAGYDKDMQSVYKKGLAETGARRAALFPNSNAIAGLSPEQRIQLLTHIEKTEFFAAIRRHTILGFFGHPRYGGNRNGASAKLLGIQETMMYSPPFGYYDREAAQ